MPQPIARIKSPPYWRVLLGVSFLNLLLSLLAWRVDPQIALAIALGGATSIVPQGYFAWQVFRYTGARAAQHVQQAFYKGETGKYLLTASMFAGVFMVVKPLNVPAMFLAYIGFQVLSWIGNAVLLRRRR